MGFFKKLGQVVGNVGAIVATEASYRAHQASKGAGVVGSKAEALLDKAVVKTAELKTNHSNRRVRIEEK